MAISPQWLDELRSRITLSALIGRTVKVTKAGREFKACCPFHNEKTPSFTINDGKGFYHCFGCSAHGDAIRWMTDQRGLSFMDAIKELASEAGMEVPAADPQAAKRAERAKSLYDVMEAAQKWFAQQLQGSVAEAYLAKRKLTKKTISEFGFGFAPESRNKLREALKSFGDAMLIESGLLISVDDKEPYDRFRGRLMIPIRDPRGRVIAFGGRILGEGEPKYLNSPDTPLFDKGRTLYNVHNAAPASRQSNRIIVAEGYMDVIALAQAGFTDAVAPLGTALTEQQIKMLWRMTDKPLVCFDGDEAGRKASMRAAIRALPFIEPGYSLQFVDLPPGQDPDDIISANGAGEMGRIFERAHNLVDHIWSEERRKIPFNKKPDADDRIALRDRLEKIARTISNPMVAKEYERALIGKFFDEFGFKKVKGSGLSEAIGGVFHTNKKTRQYLTHRAVLLGLSRYPKVIRNSAEKIMELPIGDHNVELQEMRDILLKVVMAEPEVEEDIIEQIWATELNPPFQPRDFAKDLGFSFYKKHADPTRPESDLYLVIRAIVHDDKIGKRIAEVRAMLDTDFETHIDEFKEIMAEKKLSHDRMMEAISRAASNDSLSAVA
jgi:DNA primase